jgi:pyruvate dehydrogenase E2 component (dihydrolipoamide acetyltransferase)
MPVEFTMPKLGLTMEEGTILEWLAADGAIVEKGAAILVVETDKVQTEVEASASGRLQLLGEIGATFRCGQLIGRFFADGESVDSASGPSGATASEASVETELALGQQAEPGGGNAATSGLAPGHGVALAGVQGNAVLASGPPWSGDAPAQTTVGVQSNADTRLFASPYARTLAKELNVPIELVIGSGPDGRIVAEDVFRNAALLAIPAVGDVDRTQGAVGQRPEGQNSSNRGAGDASASPGAESAGGAIGDAVGDSVQFGSRAKSGWIAPKPPATFAAAALAQLLGVDLASVPLMATSADGRLSREDVARYAREQLHRGGAVVRAVALPTASQEPTAIVPLRGMRGVIAERMHASLRESAQLTLMMDADLDAVVADRDRRKALGGPTPSFTDYVLGASARALREHPRLNAMITADGIALLPNIHVGMAVALTEGLVVPVIRDTDSLALEELSAQTSRLAEAARSGSLKLADMEGGTFSVSTLGMFGVDGFTPVINPPNAAILGVGRLRDDAAWAADGSLRRVKRLTLSLTWDHRIADGAPAAEFVRTICRLLDDPSTLT